MFDKKSNDTKSMYSNGVTEQKATMIRKIHNHRPQTNPWHREEETHFGIEEIVCTISNVDSTVFDITSMFMLSKCCIYMVRRVRESPPQLENRIMARVYVRSIMGSTMYQKAPFC